MLLEEAIVSLAQQEISGRKRRRRNVDCTEYYDRPTSVHDKGETNGNDEEDNLAEGENDDTPPDDGELGLLFNSVGLSITTPTIETQLRGFNPYIF